MLCILNIVVTCCDPRDGIRHHLDLKMIIFCRLLAIGSPLGGTWQKPILQESWHNALIPGVNGLRSLRQPLPDYVRDLPESTWADIQSDPI
jgi:hypothetical protein